MASTDEIVNLAQLPEKVIDASDFIPIVTSTGATRKGKVEDILNGVVALLPEGQTTIMNNTVGF